MKNNECNKKCYTKDKTNVWFLFYLNSQLLLTIFPTPNNPYPYPTDNS